MSSSTSVTFSVQGTCCICFVRRLDQNDSVHKAQVITGRDDIFEKFTLFHDRQVKPPFSQVKLLVAISSDWKVNFAWRTQQVKRSRIKENKESLLSMWFSLAWWQLVFCPAARCWAVSYLFLQNTPVIPTICFTVTWECLSELGKAVFPLAPKLRTDSVVSNGGQQHAGMIRPYLRMS